MSIEESSALAQGAAAPGWTAVVLAGQRPGEDPLAAAFGLRIKALVPLAGRSMVSHVLALLARRPDAARIVVVAQDVEPIAADWDGYAPAGPTRIGFRALPGSIADVITALVEEAGTVFPLLVTTADNVLLDDATLDAFVAGATEEPVDVAFGVVERRTLLDAYPGNERTWLRFRGGAYSGANLFWIGGPAAGAAIERWRGIEQGRKKGRAVIRAFGLFTLVGALLRLVSLRGAVARAARRMGIAAAVVELWQPEAAIDVDRVADHVLAEEVLARRRAGG